MMQSVVGYRDREGKEITLHEWADLESDEAYKFLRRETLPNGRYVVTIWNGVVSPALGGLFSTGVFPHAPGEDGHLRALLHEEHFDTEADALAGHARLAAEWSSR